MAPLPSDAKRLRTIVISFPLLVVTSAILYRRTFMGEEQRRIPARGAAADPQQAAGDSILHHGTAIGGAPWVRQGEEANERGR